MQVANYLFLEKADCADQWGLLDKDKHIYTSELQDGAVLYVLIEGATPAEFDEIFTKNANPEWRIWCHFGGDVGCNGWERAWKEWSGCSEKIKEQILLKNKNESPRHFSWGQRLDWSSDIVFCAEQIKKKKNNELLLYRLNLAWEKSERQLSLGLLLEFQNKLAPILFMLGQLQNLMPKNKSDLNFVIPEIFVQCLERFYAKFKTLPPALLRRKPKVNLSSGWDGFNKNANILVDARKQFKALFSSIRQSQDTEKQRKLFADIYNELQTVLKAQQEFSDLVTILLKQRL